MGKHSELTPNRRTIPTPTEYANDITNPEIVLLRNMLTIPSYSGQEGSLARFLAEQARHMGLDAYVDEAGNMVAATAPRAGSKWKW